jgi:hypothetical protein
MRPAFVIAAQAVEHLRVDLRAQDAIGSGLDFTGTSRATYRASSTARSRAANR